MPGIDDQSAWDDEEYAANDGDQGVQTLLNDWVDDMANQQNATHNNKTTKCATHDHWLHRWWANSLPQNNTSDGNAQFNDFQK